MSDGGMLRVDGIEAAPRNGETVLELLERLGHGVPHVCFHPSLGALQTCDTCMVEVDNRLVRACGTKARPGAVVSTQSLHSLEARKEAMQRLIANHELYCTICDYNNGDCELHNAADDLKISRQKYEFQRKGYEPDQSNPFYRYDPDQCLLCGRCVEACQNVEVNETLSIDWTMERPRVLWDGGKAINDSSCVSCGHCVTVCPCNALLEKTMEGRAGHFTAAPDSVKRKAIELVKFSEAYIGLRPLFETSKAEAAMREETVKRTKTVCTYCGVGCAFEVWTVGRHILKIQPYAEAPANGISTCVKGKFGWDHINAPDRLVHPLIRRKDGFRPATWDEALATVAARLRAVADEHGPDSVAFICSSKITNEEAYLVQKLARAVFRTNNVDNCARYCQSPASKGLNRTVGIGGDAGTMNDIEKADLVFIVGSNTAVSHPVLASRIKRQVKLRGQKLIVSDLRRHEMARRAHIFLRPAPSTDIVWINAVARYILEQDWEDKEYVASFVNGLEEYKRSLEKFTLEYAVETTGLGRETLIQVATEIAQAETVCGLWAMGVTQHSGGTDTCTAICNLLLLTGNFGKPGTGAYPLRGHNNVQGSCDFGALCDVFPGYHKVGEKEARERLEKAWGVLLPSEKGLNNTSMIDAIHEGKLKALFVVGEELSLVDANANRVQEALEKLEFFVVQDVFFSNTARYADVVLAASPSLEKDGTFVNTERRIQRLYQALEPLGQSRPDWIILRDLAARLGHHWDYQHPSDIMDEVAALTPEFAGVRYDRLEGWKSLCWPVKADGTDTPLLYADMKFKTEDGKAKFHPVDFTPPANQRTEQFTLHLNNGRVLEHFHEGNFTHRSPGLHSKVEGDYVDVSPEDSERLGVREGDWVRLVSPFGQVKTRVIVTGECRAGEMYMPVCSSDERVNYLTSSKFDPVVSTPAYKEISVQLIKLNQSGTSPTPRGNPRFGHPTPQESVRVEEKWRRSDYRYPDHDRAKGAHV